MTSGRFDRGYYDRYYRDASTQVASASDTARLARFVTGYLDYLGIEVRSILDVGAGVGLWRAPLRRAYPAARYVGLELSAHVAAEHGWVQGSITTYRGRSADLVICQGVLQYVPDRDLGRAIDRLAALTRGALYLEALTRRDWEENVDKKRTDGDVNLRTGRRYRRLLRDAGFRACGGGVFLAPGSSAVLYELEEA
jgi:SAM-dependent methyltransferase